MSTISTTRQHHCLRQTSRNPSSLLAELHRVFPTSTLPPTHRCKYLNNTHLSANPVDKAVSLGCKMSLPTSRRTCSLWNLPPKRDHPSHPVNNLFNGHNHNRLRLSSRGSARSTHHLTRALTHARITAVTYGLIHRPNFKSTREKATDRRHRRRHLHRTSLCATRRQDRTDATVSTRARVSLATRSSRGRTI